MALEHIDLNSLPKDTTFKILTGPDPKLLYEVKIIRPGETPTCEMAQYDSEGKLITGPTFLDLIGSGRWTTVEQNPTQTGDPVMGKPHQPKAMSIDHGKLSVGGLIIVHNLDSGAFVYLQPPCTEIQI